MGRPREHDAERGDALLEAAESLLEEHGPSALSIRAVADAAGTTTRAVYSLFGSKEGLVQALAIRGYHILTDLVESLPETDDPTADLIAAGSSGFRVFAVAHPHLFRLTFERVPAEVSTDRATRTALADALAALVGRIERAQAAGTASALPATEVAFAFHSLCHGLASNELLMQAPPVGAGFWGFRADADPTASWDAAVGALVRGLPRMTSAV